MNDAIRGQDVGLDNLGGGIGRLKEDTAGLKQNVRVLSYKPTKIGSH